MLLNKFIRPILLLGLLALTACGFNPRASSVSLNGDVLIRTWQCEDPLVRAAVEKRGPDGTPASVAEKLLECPFYRDYQIEAMKPEKSGPVSPDMLAEIVYKIRWGIDFQYREYEKMVLNGPKKRFFIPRMLHKLSPGLGDLFRLTDFLMEEPVKVGQAAPLLARQMQQDRNATGAALERRMEAFRKGRRDYPLWQAMIDLDAYFVAGTVPSAMISLDAGLQATNKSTDIQ